MHFTKLITRYIRNSFLVSLLIKIYTISLYIISKKISLLNVFMSIYSTYINKSFFLSICLFYSGKSLTDFDGYFYWTANDIRSNVSLFCFRLVSSYCRDCSCKKTHFNLHRFLESDIFLLFCYNEIV